MARRRKCSMKGKRWVRRGSKKLVLLRPNGDAVCTVALTDPGHPRHRWEAIYWGSGRLKHPRVGYYKALATAQGHCECGTVRDIHKD